MDTAFETTAFVRNAHPDARMSLAGKMANQEHLDHRMDLIGDRLELVKALPKGTPKKDAKRKKKAGLADDDPERCRHCASAA